jgi:excisionase family DNA binding protein
MSELLTTREVQNILKVDRITVYRMLQDGRLKGVKIGQQWRFPRDEVQRLVNGLPATGSLPATGGLPITDGDAPAEAQPATAAAPLPVHCLQTVQNLFSSVSGLGSIVIDASGEPVTALSGACALCRMMQESLAGNQACRESWRAMAAGSANGERQFTCHAGLTSITAPILDGSTLVGWILVGQALLSDADAQALLDKAPELARRYALPVSAVQESIRKAPIIPSSQHDQMHSWVKDASKAMESILQERSGFIVRMQRIADLTQLG